MRVRQAGNFVAIERSRTGCFGSFLRRIRMISDAYEVTEEEKSLEVVVRMININYGRNKELMQGCSKLEEYAFFIHQVRLNLQALTVILMQYI